MAASRLFVCLHVLVFWQVIIPASMTYVDYDIASDRVCSRLGKRELSISFNRPLLVREGGRLLSNWPGAHYFSCRWEVEAKGRGLGVVAVIQKLKFRSVGDECLDYVKFKEDGVSEPRYPLCKTIYFGLPVLGNMQFPKPPYSSLPPTPPTTPMTALSIFSTIFKGTPNPWMHLTSHGTSIDPRGEMKTYVYVAAKALRGDDSLAMVIAYTGFQECDGSRIPSTLFHCGYGLCISRQFVHDGVVNCPFGDCVDEGNCEMAMNSNLTAHILGQSMATRERGGIPPEVAATSSVFAIAILVTIGACICFILRRNRERRQEQAGDYIGVPLSAVGQPMPGSHIVPKPVVGPGDPVGTSSQPHAAPIGFFVPGAPGTAYPSNIGAPYPYPSTGAPYPVQPPPSSSTAPSAPSQEPPPPYSALFPDQ